MKKVILIVVALVLLSVGLIQAIWQPQLQRFSHGVNKYTTINLPQNSGLHFSALWIMSRINGLYPELLNIHEGNIARIFNKFPRVDIEQTALHEYNVASVESLKEILGVVKPNSVIWVEPGTYTLSGKSIKLNRNDSLNGRIEIRARVPLQSTFVSESSVGFEVRTQGWTFNGFVFRGECEPQARCEHAIHVKGNADNLRIINNDFIDYNAAIKSNGEINELTKLREFPDEVSISHNRFFNQSIRMTKNPVTPIDVVGGDNWHIDQNFIADFVKNGGNRISYGAFLKGGGQFGKITDNVFVCRWKLPYTSAYDARVGVSFGGGGTGVRYCQSKDCEYEHKNGVLANNMVLNCSNEVALYVNKSEDIQINDNYLINTLGVDVSFGSRNIYFNNNHYHGDVRVRDTSSNIVFTDNKVHWWFDPIMDHAPR